MRNLNKPISFKHGKGMKNGFMLAPLTNQQSNEDGTLSDDEYRWLVKRAEGNFGLTITCAANVQEVGKTWPGQLGVFGDQHLEGLTRLAAGIHQHGGHASVQLFHGGRRATRDLINGPLQAPSFDRETGAEAMSLEAVKALRDDFIAAAVRCHKAGFDGVELHAAHGFVICQFLSPQFNHRDDEYGGTAENRARLLHEILAGIRKSCGEDFAIGVRLSPERHGLLFGDMLALTTEIMTTGQVDFVDMSMRDVFKYPDDENFQQKTLCQWYLDLPRGDAKMGVGGKIRTAEDVLRINALGPDFVVLGHAGILHHNFPDLMADSPDFVGRQTPVGPDILREEGLSETFITYLETFPEFVAQS